MPNRLLREGVRFQERAEKQLLSATLANQTRRERMKKAGTLPRAAVNRLLDAATGKPCPVCHEAMARWCSRRVPSLDHILAISKGGTNDISNLRVICNRCNAKKGNR